MSYFPTIPKSPHHDLLVALANAIPHLPENDKAFAMSLQQGHNKYNGWSDKQAIWAEKMVQKVVTPVAKTAAQVSAEQHAALMASWKASDATKVKVIGDLAKMSEMMAKAGTHLKKPSVLLHIEGGGFGPLPKKVKVKQSSQEGAFIVTSDGTPSLYYGKISPEGIWMPKPSLNEGVKSALAAVLKEFAANPVKVAAHYGHLHGKCCFCNKGLTDPKSTLVGYGPICATHYSLPWGDTPALLKLSGAMKSIPITTKEQKLMFTGMDFAKGKDMNVVILKEAPHLPTHFINEDSIKGMKKAMGEHMPEGFLKAANSVKELSKIFADAKEVVMPTMTVLPISTADYDRLLQPVEYLF